MLLPDGLNVQYVVLGLNYLALISAGLRRDVHVLALDFSGEGLPVEQQSGAM